MEIIIATIVLFYAPQLAIELKTRVIRHRKHYRA